MEMQLMEKVQQDNLNLFYNHRPGVALSKDMQDFIQKITVNVKKYGSDFEVKAMSIDGECERELEQEVES
jgi:hypothetical protein